jgi:hypothetical protein
VRRLQQALDVEEDGPTAEERFQIAPDRASLGVQGQELRQKLALASSPFHEGPEKTRMLGGPERGALVGTLLIAGRSAG